MFSFITEQTTTIYSSLRDEFIRDLEKNVKAETYKQTEQKLREDLKRKVKKGLMS